MIWQDYVFAAGQLVFTLSLLPSVFTKEKPNRFTCWLTASTLTVFSVTFVTLEFWFSFWSTCACALLWWVLTVQQEQKRAIRL